MLIPVCCFSCGQCIGHLWEYYKNLVNYYNKNYDTIIDTIINKKNVNINYVNQNVVKRIDNTELPLPSAEEMAMIYLGISRLCCKRMFLTQADTYYLMNLNK